MIKKFYFILAVLLLMPLINAEEWAFNSESITTNLKIYSDLDIIKTTSNSKVTYVKVNLTFFPKDSTRQKLLAFDTIPEADKNINSVQYTWQNPTENNLKFSLTSDVKLLNYQVKVKKKVKFPISVPEKTKIYTKPSETVDSDNQAIFALANDLAKGEDDMYKVVFNLAEWVKDNIEYDLSTLTADVTQSSSWVLKTRQGVCDELTNLFIALNRALGIPAKFVSGIAYTTSEQFEEEWGPHGWAEVYFPGYGWIPFDVTYGELGYIDPTHIKLKESLDAKESATKYQWLGTKVDIETKKLNFDINLKEYKGEVSPKLSLEIDPLKSAVAFGSYNLIEATIKNLRDYYIADEIYLSRSKETEIEGDERKQILLEPNEEKKIYWIIKTSSNLKKRFVYTFPLTIQSLGNTTASASFDSSENDYFYDLNEIESILNLKQEKEEKTYSKNIDLSCAADKNSFYEYEETIVLCDLKNIGNIILENFDFCLEDCKKLTLGIGEEEQVRFDFKPKKTGEQELLLEAKNLKSEFLKINVLDTPKIDIIELAYPVNVSFRDNYNISFVLDKKSVSIPKDVIIDLNEEGFTKTWELSQLTNDQRFVINLRAKDLGIGENNLVIQLRFYDNNNKEYYTEKNFTIKLNRVSFFQRIQIFVTDIAKFLNSLF